MNESKTNYCSRCDADMVREGTYRPTSENAERTRWHCPNCKYECETLERRTGGTNE